jgi:hypothetical protein
VGGTCACPKLGLAEWACQRDMGCGCLSLNGTYFHFYHPRVFVLPSISLNLSLFSFRRSSATLLGRVDLLDLCLMTSDRGPTQFASYQLCYFWG